jgi:uncharacterized lipoprotein YajG
MGIKSQFVLVTVVLLAIAAALAGCRGNQSSTAQTTSSQPSVSQPSSGQDTTNVPDTQPDGRVRRVQPAGND